MSDARVRPLGRPAFTLIELLVVIAVILVIFSIGIGFVVSTQDHRNAVTGSDKLSGWLLNAKQRARRDRVPTGIRILFPNGATQASQLMYVQQPDDYNTGTCQSDLTDPTFSTVLFQAAGPLAGQPGTGVDFQGGASYVGQSDLAPVEIGDYFTAAGSGVVHRINTVTMPTATTGSVKLDSPCGVLAPGTLYTIIRAPRRMPSEDLLQLPPGAVVIDNTQCLNLPMRTLTDTSGTQQVAEILFAPNGSVVGQGTGADKIILWLRDPAQAQPTGGTPLLVSIQIRTGFIGVFPVAAGANPYANALDPRSSGM